MATIPVYQQQQDGTLRQIGTVDQDPAVANAGALVASVQAKLTQVEAWIAANPNGAVLNAAQTLALAKMLVGLGRLQLQLLATVGQAT